MAPLREPCAPPSLGATPPPDNRPHHDPNDLGVVRRRPDWDWLVLRAWFSAHGHDDASLAIDGKTMKGAVDEAGRQVHILGACGHDTAIAWGQKKPC